MRTIRQRRRTHSPRTYRSLYQLAGPLSAAESPREALDVMVRVTAAALGADGAFVARTNGTRRELVTACASGIDWSVVAPAFPCPISTHVPGTDAVRRHTPVMVGSLKDLTRRYPLVAPAAQDAGYHALAHAPLLSAGRALGVLGLAFRARRTFSSSHQRELQAVGLCCGDALSRLELRESGRHARSELARLSNRVVVAQEEERRRVARELHDEIGQALTLAMLVTQDPLRQPHDVLADVRATLGQLLERTRDLLHELHPSMLADHGLLAALLQHIEQYQRRTYITVQLTHTGLNRRFHADVEIAAFRIVQEALTNVARHASVHHVTVHLAGAASTLRLEIADHGAGFDTRTGGRSSLGLQGMRERAGMVGGELTVESSLGKGTRIRTTLPARRSPGEAS